MTVHTSHEHGVHECSKLLFQPCIFFSEILSESRFLFFLMLSILQFLYNIMQSCGLPIIIVIHRTKNVPAVLQAKLLLFASPLGNTSGELLQ